MIYLYISKIQDHYYILDSSESYNYDISSSTYGLVYILEGNYNDLIDKVRGFYGRVVERLVDLGTISTGCKKFKEYELDYHLNKKLNDYLSGFSSLEVSTWEIQRLEAQKYLESSGSYTSSILDNIAQAKGIEVNILADSIIRKSKLHYAKLLEFKLCRDRITRELESLRTLEQLEALDVVEELNKQLGITLESDEESVTSQEDSTILSATPLNKPLESIVLDSENPVSRFVPLQRLTLDSTDPTELTEDTENNELILEPLDNLKKASIAENESLEQEEQETSKTIKKRQSRYIQASSKPIRQN